MSASLSLDAVLRATGYATLDGGDAVGLQRRSGMARRVGEPDVVWRDRSGVQVHFKYSDAPADPSEVFETRQHAWNTGAAALLWMVSPERIDVYDAYGRPRDREAEEAFLLRTFSTVDDELARLDAYAGRLALETGRFWAAEERIRSHERVDAQLLDDLARLEDNLTGTGLPRKYAQALIGRTLFLSYLRDRGIAAGAQHRAFEEGAMLPWFQNKGRAYELFDWLRSTFNGDLFPIEDAEREAVEARHTSLVAAVFAGTDPDTGQGSFWPYRFDVIPVEFISSIYERFVHAEAAVEARRTGVHYTPVPLANLVLDEVLTGADPRARVLDLTCGSGIFLVEALRRLVSLRSGSSPPSRDLIRETLRSQVFGVDRSDGAIRVAAFSLYLAALELDPDPTPPEALRFEPLIGRTLFVADALGDLPPQIATGGFDVVLGNPPWTYAGPRPRLEWIESSLLPPRSADFPFVWRSLSLGHERARLGVIMRATPFFSRASASRRPCAALLRAAAPAAIVDLSSLRDELFPTADYPAVIVFGRLPQHTDPEIVPVVKVPWTPAFARTHTFEVSPDDLRTLPLKAFSADYPSLKIAAFGSSRDRMLLRRFAKDAATLEATLRDWGVSLTTGAQMLLGDRRSAAELIGLPLLRSGQLKPRIDVNTLPTFDLPEVHRPRSRNIYRAPLMLIGEGARGGRLSVGYSEHDLVYTESFYGISLGALPNETRACAAGVLSSSIPAWHILLTASEFGVHKRKLLRQDLLDLPFPTATQFATPAAAAVAAAFDAVCANGGAANRRLLDEAVFDLFDLSEQERLVVSDGADRAAREYVERRNGAERPPSNSDLHAYARAFLSVINPWRRLDGRPGFAAEVMTGASDDALRILRLLPGMVGQVREIGLNASLNEVVASLGRRIHLPVGESLRVARQLRVYAGEEIFVLKPAARRYWSPAAGLADADKCLGDSLAASEGVENLANRPSHR